MEDRPLATVAMVTCDSERYVAQAIESVLRSSCPNFELVICDDCSTDDTWNIVQRYQDQRVRAFRNPDRMGEYPNRNEALRQAQGKYIIYIDGDDVLYEHGLQQMVGMLEAFPEAAMAMSRPWSDKFIYPVMLTAREFQLCEFLGPAVVAINFAHVMFRVEALNAVGGLDTRYRSGDTYIQLAIGLAQNSLLISDGLAWWRRTPGQASEEFLRDHENSLEGLRYRIRLLESEKCLLTPSQKRRSRANLYGGFIRITLRFLLKARVRRAAYLIRQAHIPKRAWCYAFLPARYSYLNDVSAANPRTSDARITTATSR